MAAMTIAAIEGGSNGGQVKKSLRAWKGGYRRELMKGEDPKGTTD